MSKKNPLEQSIRSAARANVGIGNMFARIGTTEHPGGFVTTAYRNTSRAMTVALAEPRPAIAVQDVLHGLRGGILPQIKTTFQDAQLFGIKQAATQLTYYGVKTVIPAGVVMGLSKQAQSAYDVIAAKLAVQEATVNALIASDADPVLITGDGERAGILRASDIAAAGVFWIAALIWDAMDWWANGRDGGGESGGGFMKQAVAVLDNSTTDCCLQVHGQVQAFADPFQLDGTPRYADEIDYPPFHGYCRTSVALYQDAYDNGLTDKMRAGADQVLAERADGIYKDRSPADAFG
jgi:hypothetical protein